METAICESKPRLVFGNPDHIRLAKQAEGTASQTKYRVKIEIWDDVEVEVVAADEDEAVDSAWDEISLGDFRAKVKVTKIE